MPTTQSKYNAEVQSILNQAKDDIDHGRLSDAESRYLSVLKLIPADPHLHLTLGLLYHEQGRFNAAVTEIKRAIRLNPDDPAAHRGLGDALDAAGQTEAAINAYESACALDPEYIQALLNLGNAFHKTDRHEDALSAFQKVLELRHDHPPALNNIGKTFHDMGLLERALKYYDQALKSDPDYAEAHFNRSVALITLEDYANGWKAYEWRFKRKSAANVYPYQLASPRWQGQTYKGQRLLVHCEQGFGDVLQFARYLPMVKALGGEVILQAHPPLMPLLENLDCVDRLIPFDLQKRPDTPHDMHVPLLSLPNIFGTTSATIPKAFPYLRPNPERNQYWADLLPTDKRRIGLVWSASALNKKRNFPISLAADWFQIPGLAFYSLQMGPDAGQIGQFGDATKISRMGKRLSDFGETAALINNLDLVISVDTAVAHLAGALGIPLWVLLPHASDWRWPAHHPTSPWYPEARLFRQTALPSWEDVADRVTQALTAWCRNQQLPANRAHAEQPSTNARPSPETRSAAAVRTVQSARPEIKKVLLVSPLLGGSLEVMRYLAGGFRQAGKTTYLLDNSKYYGQFQEINAAKRDEREKTVLMDGFLAGLDERLLEHSARFKPDLVMAIAQSPIENHTVQKLKKDGIVCAYWFVEDYRFREYWSDIAPAYDFFFMIQRDEHLAAAFDRMPDTTWHYLPTACEPSLHKPWIATGSADRHFDCQIGFMGAPYLNRLHVFDQLTAYDLKIWGEGWRDQALSPALRACVQKGPERTSPGDSVKIYSRANLVINLHSSPFSKDISAEGNFVNPRTFEVAGCGGFQLTDFRSEILPLFTPGEEIILFHDLEELQALIRYWLEHDHMREQVSRKAQARAYAQHTYRHRADEILRIIESG